MIREKTQKIFAAGVDLGRPGQGTAISIVQSVRGPSSHTEPLSDQPSLHVRHLVRFPPDTPYPDIARALSGLLNLLQQRESTEKTDFGPRDVDVTLLLVIDQTAVGSSVVDMVLNIVKRPGRRVVISGSHDPGYSNGHDIVPKSEMISLLQALLGMGHLKFAEALPELKDLVDELINYQDQKTNAMPLPDAWREHPSDDLVFAVALACWGLKKDIRFSCDWI